MPKLPKALQAKQKEKMAKVKPSTKSAASSSRAMRRQMQKQGIENVNEVNATRVIIQCPDKDIVIENPQVMQLKQQGMTIHQILGEPIERESSSYDEENSEESEDYEEYDEEYDEESVISGEIRQEDIAIVAAQAGVSEKEAEQALIDAEGDLARAILKLKS